MSERMSLTIAHKWTLSCVAVLGVSCGHSAVAAPNAGQDALKAKYRSIYDSDVIHPTAEDLSRDRQIGDVVQAAIDIFREEEASGHYRGFLGVHMMGIVLRSGDPRAHDFFMPYLIGADHTDPRWLDAVEYSLVSEDPTGEKWIKAKLSLPSEEMEEIADKGVLLQKIGFFLGTPRWAEYLRALPVAPYEERWILERKADAIRALESRFPAVARSGVSMTLAAPATTFLCASDVEAWRKGRGEFPFVSTDDLSQEEVIRGLRELAFQEPLQSGVALTYILDVIRSSEDRAAIAELRKKYTAWPSIRGKVAIAGCLVDLGDYTGVSFVQDLYQTSSNTRVRRTALDRVLRKCLSTDRIQELFLSETDQSLKSRLEILIKERGGAERSFHARFERVPREIDTPALGEARLESDPGEEEIIQVELYRRRSPK